jgi:NADPH-dependent 7-cyano-7-deazaguanine reductase QueF
MTVTEIEELRAYMNGVMNRADHHAGAVNEIALALISRSNPLAQRRR